MTVGATVAVQRSVWAAWALAALIAVCGCSSITSGGGDAEAIVERIARMVPSAHRSMAAAAYDDPLTLFSRRDAYRSKSEFTDSRLTGGMRVEGAVSGGGSVEVFDDVPTAKYRMVRLQEHGKGTSVAVEYDYLSGPILLRLSSDLTMDQVAEYEAALDELSN